MEPDLDRLGHLNLIEFCRELTRWTERGVLHEEGGVLCFANGGTDFPVVLNGAHRVDPTADAAEVVARAQAFFGDLGRGFSLQLQVEAEADIVEAAAAAGLHELMGSPEMLCHAPLPEPIPGDGVELRPVTTTDHVAA